ncbi:SDR family NAD(P)-dependent oxidoreductase, partial [Streptomyces sp. bgisy159]|uniref:SDR family NAD(P)-dependent oxidoreductase n=1 Tax=Streptomyces sp. bgisy159 TaxID=3413795 RepID=UPI003F4A65E6
MMEPMLDAFREVAERIAYVPPVIPVVSNLTGQLATGEELASSEYWVRHVRDTVRFADGVTALNAHGVTRFLEIGPDGTLTALTRNSVPDDSPALLTPTLRKDTPEHPAVLRAMALLHVDGGEIDWAAVLRGSDGETTPVDLPTYQFQHRRYWLAPNEPSPGGPCGPTRASTVVDADFWTAVEREDLSVLAEDLDLPADTLEPVVPALSRWYRQRQDRAALDALRYEVSWLPLTRHDETTTTAGRPRTGNWTVLLPTELDASSRRTADDLLLGLREHGITPYVAEVTDPTDPAEALRFTAAETDGVLSLLGLAAHVDPVVTTLTALRGVAESPAAGVRLWALTQGAVGVGGADRAVSPEQSAVWGLGRVAALEHPDTWGGLIDLPADVDDRVCARLAKALTRLRPGEDQVAVRAHAVFGRRLAQTTPLSSGTPAWKPDGTVLITGGTGALGAHVARWAVERGARTLLLVSRRGEAAPGATALREELQRMGAQVTLAAADVSVRAELAGLLAAHPVDAVFHTAGILDDATLLATDAERIDRVRGPKATGALLLDELTQDRDLSAFVLFSSLAGTLGSPGQGAYAAANAVLDALAERRRAEGRPATSIAWGPWAGDGMAAESGGRRRGQGAVTALDPRLALSALGAALDTGVTTQLIADIDWPDFVPAFTAVRPSALLTPVAPADSTPEPRGTQRTGSELRARVAGVPRDAGQRLVVEHVQEVTALVLGHDGPEQVGAERAFRDLGVDSLIAVELRNVLAAAAGVTLPATAVFDHPTPQALAAHIYGELFDEVTSTASTASVATDEPVAIVGMACRFPGGVESPEDLWELLADGRDGIVDFPEDRGWAALDNAFYRYAQADGRSPGCSK